jgi:hypothetical protein
MVIVVPVVSRGVTPEPTVIAGVTEPLHRIGWVPVGGVALLFEVAKNVTLPVPPVPAGKSMLAMGLIEEGSPVGALQAAVVRATLTLVYEV